jgi:hypothetical protein
MISGLEQQIPFGNDRKKGKGRLVWVRAFPPFRKRRERMGTPVIEKLKEERTLLQ